MIHPARKIAIVYATVDGQALKICQVISTFLNKNNLHTEMYPMDSFEEDPLAFDTLVIGASIRYGKHSSMVSKFIWNNKDKLSKIKTAFFSVNLVARKKGKGYPGSNPYLNKFLKKVAWKPGLSAAFAGKLDYPSYSFIDRVMIQLIMKLTGGPTRSEKPIEYTDWERVEEFSREICKMNDPPGPTEQDL